MSDEKEIIEILENLVVDKYIDERKLEEKDIEAIINIIVLYRQEKEKNKELSDKLTEKICKGVEEEILEEYRQTIISKDKEIEELKEQCKEVVCIPEGSCFMIEPKDVDKKWKDKIKAKIEELIKEGNYRTVDNPNGRVHFQKEITDYQIEVLQSLLEKE